MKPRQPQYDGKGHFRLCSNLLHNWSSIIRPMSQYMAIISALAESAAFTCAERIRDLILPKREP